jgi:hypothetical protein
VEREREREIEERVRERERKRKREVEEEEEEEARGREDGCYESCGLSATCNVPESHTFTETFAIKP